MDILLTIGIISFIIYLRFYADLRVRWEKELDQLQPGIALYQNHQLPEALAYFTDVITHNPQRSVAYLYRARCYRLMGQPTAALQDLATGKSYDDTLPELHLESGQILYEQQQYAPAFLDFDKAIFHSHGQLAEAYRWRGQSAQQLGRPEQARQDWQQAEQLAAAVHPKPVTTYANYSFFDRRFLLHMALLLLSSLLLLLIIKRSPVILFPYLAAAITSAGIGFLEPRKGWALALLQASILWIGYTFFTDPPQNNAMQELQSFGLYGAIGLTFVGSFIGGLLQRQLQR